MAADINDIVELGIIAFAAYIVYEIYTGSTDFINKLFGVSSGAGSYTGAAATVVQHPVGSLESILGVGPGYSNDWLTSLASSLGGQGTVGTPDWITVTAGSQTYRCDPSNNCYPISVDANGVQTVSGVMVPYSSLTPPLTMGDQTSASSAW